MFKVRKDGEGRFVVVANKGAEAGQTATITETDSIFTVRVEDKAGKAVDQQKTFILAATRDKTRYRSRRAPLKRIH